jgi:uncharacterized protein (TIGR02246 family)
MIYKALFFFLFINLFGVFASAQNNSKNETVLKSLVDKMIAAQSTFDAKALDSIFTPDYIEISPLGEFDPRAKVLGFYTPEAKKALGSTTYTVKAVDHSIRIFNKFAVVIVQQDIEMSVDNKPQPTRSMRTTFVCRKEGGEWKIASTQYTGIRKSSSAGASK